MLAVTTQNGTSLINPTSLKNSRSFPISSSLGYLTNAWSPDNSHLYLASASSIKKYTPSECLLEELYYGSDTVTSLALKEQSNLLFFAAANKVWSLDCTHSPGKVLSSLEPHNSPVTKISMSNDGALLASASASAVFIHNLALLSYTQLKGLPDGKPASCVLFHQHSRTKLLLGIGRDLVVYDSVRPGSPLKTIRIPGGDIVGIAASPFSKTLVAVVTSNGDVVLVDLDKDNGVLKSVNMKTPLTCCAFTAEGAAIYLGTESGQLLVLDLRALEKEPKAFTIGDGSAPVKTINVQSKSHLGDATSTKTKSSLTAIVKSSPQRPVSLVSTCTASSNSVAGSRVKSAVRATVASKIRGGGVTPKKKLFSPPRVPLSETKNLALDGQLAASRSPIQSRRMKPLRLGGSKEHEKNHEAQARAPSPTSCAITQLENARQRIRPASSHSLDHLGLGPAPESISGHLAAMRVQSGSPLNDGPRAESNRAKSTTRRVVSESVEGVLAGQKLRSTSTGSAYRVSSSKGIITRMQKLQEQRPTTPDNGDDHIDLSSPDLPREPVTPISLGKNIPGPPLTSVTCGVHDFASHEGAKLVKGESQKEKGKEKMVEVKKARFARHPDAKEPWAESDEPKDEDGPEVLPDERRDEEREQELSLQVSPRRPTAAPTWLQSPHRPSAASMNMNAAAQDFLRGIVHDVMYDFQRETKAEMMGLHLDLVRMGRGWKRELREVMEEWSEEMKELKAENRRLKEENERLRRRG